MGSVVHKVQLERLLLSDCITNLDVAQASQFRMCRNLNMGDVLRSDFFHPPTQYDTIKHTCACTCSRFCVAHKTRWAVLNCTYMYVYQVLCSTQDKRYSLIGEYSVQLKGKAKLLASHTRVLRPAVKCMCSLQYTQVKTVTCEGPSHAGTCATRVPMQVWACILYARTRSQYTQYLCTRVHVFYTCQQEHTCTPTTAASKNRLINYAWIQQCVGLRERQL